MEPFVILLIMAAISFFNWLIKRMQENAEAKERDGQSKGEAPTTGKRRGTGLPKKSEEERLREFMEALGVPKEKLPQPRRQEPPPIPRQTPPTAMPKKEARTPPPMPARRQAAPSPLMRTERKPVTQPAPGVEIPSPQPVPPVTAAAESSPAPPVLTPSPAARDAYRLSASRERAGSVPAVELGNSLRTREGFRAAVLLREILGPPKSLRAQEELPSLL